MATLPAFEPQTKLGVCPNFFQSILLGLTAQNFSIIKAGQTAPPKISGGLKNKNFGARHALFTIFWRAASPFKNIKMQIGHKICGPEFHVQMSGVFRYYYNDTEKLPKRPSPPPPGGPRSSVLEPEISSGVTKKNCTSNFGWSALNN